MKKIKEFIKKRWYFVLIILVLGFIGLMQLSGSPAKLKKEITHKVKKQDLKDTLSVSGNIDAEEAVVLRFQSSGRLVWIGVKEGDYVKKYQALASLDQRDIKNRMQKYLNTYVQNRISFDQTTDDKSEKNIGGLSTDLRQAGLRVLAKAQYDLNNSVLDVELQSLSFEYASLISPVEGIVTKAPQALAGTNITPAQAEFQVINPKTVFFSATADQNDVVKLKQGLEGEVILDAFPDIKIPGKIHMISFIPKEGETGTVYEIKISLMLDKANYQYRFGMTGDASFVLRTVNNVLSVPSGAIKSENGKKYIMKKVNGNKVKTYIGVGEEIANETEITSGLQPGDIVYD